MPKGTKVDKVYKALRGEGMSKGKAARIAQAKTGKSLKTGKAPKKRGEEVKPAVTDGFYVLAWPEVENLCRLFGVDPEKMDDDRAGLVGVELRMTDADLAPVLTAVTETGLGRDYAHHPYPGHCFDLYKTPEFKAFCRRLGIRRELYTKAITVRIFEGEQPTTTQTYAMCENGEYPPDPDAETGVLDTLKLANGVHKDVACYQRAIADHINEKGPVGIRVSYPGEDKEYHPDVVIDTTSMYNREYRTKVPGGGNG